MGEVKERESQTIKEAERYKIGYKITFITIIINIILAIVKISVGILSNSTAILADGVHTVSDVISSIGIIFGFFISQKPEDIEHQYGHEKAESIAGFVLAILLTVVGIKIGISTIEMVILGNAKMPGILSVWVAGISIAIKEIQYRIAMDGGKKINSSALKADAWHHRSDALSSIGALIGIIGARMGYSIFDPIAGFIVAIIVIKVGIELLIQGYNELMDSSIEKSELYNLADRIISHKGIINVNQIKARKHGSKVYFDVKICVNSKLTVEEGHNIAEEVEKTIYSNVENTKDVIVHVNPCHDSKTQYCIDCVNETSRFLKKETDSRI